MYFMKKCNRICDGVEVGNDATMCKQYLAPEDILTGPRLQIMVDEFRNLKLKVETLSRENTLYELQIKELKRELALLNIIKQTMEMTSGMTFDFREEDLFE